VVFALSLILGAVYDRTGAFVGVSEFREPGEYEEVTVELDADLAGERLLLAVAHRDTDGDRFFGFDPEAVEPVDGPYLNETSDPVFDGATVTFPGEPVGTTVEGTTLPVDDQSSEGPAAPNPTSLGAVAVLAGGAVLVGRAARR
jgi:hypothetical protein